MQVVCRLTLRPPSLKYLTGADELVRSRKKRKHPRKAAEPGFHGSGAMICLPSVMAALLSLAD
jgi:hypothetical protein